MSTTLYYFTGTGNALHIAKTIAAGLVDAELIPINTLDVTRPISTDATTVGIIYPTYFLDAPKIIHDFVKQLKVIPNAYLFLYAHYGETLGNALSNPYSVLEKRGITVSATYEAALPDNSIIFPTKKEKQPMMHQKADQQLIEQIQMISSKKPITAPTGNAKDRLAGGLMKFASHHYLGFDQIKIKADKCNNCGLCIKVCSMKNITAGAEQPLVSHNCAMCFSCIHYCPREAVKFKRMKPQENYQYQHPNITITEIVASRLKKVE